MGYLYIECYDRTLLYATPARSDFPRYLKINMAFMSLILVIVKLLNQLNIAIVTPKLKNKGSHQGS